MSEKAKFQFYETFENIINLLPNEEQLKFYKSLVRYGLFAEEPKLEGKDVALFQPIREALDDQYTRRIKNKDNGKKGGAPKGNRNATKEQPKTTENNPKQAKTTETSETPNKNWKEKKKNEKEMRYDCDEPPRPEPVDVHDFYLHEHLASKPYDFYIYNCKHDWTDKDGNPIRDWKAAYLGFEKANPDETLEHNPDLKFDLMDYLA